jgi:hypothetical protein
VTDDGPALQKDGEGREHGVHRGRLPELCAGQAGEFRDDGRQIAPRIDEGVEGGDDVSASHPGGRDLDDAVVDGGEAGGLAVDDDAVVDGRRGGLRGGRPAV